MCLFRHPTSMHLKFGGKNPLRSDQVIADSFACDLRVSLRIPNVRRRVHELFAALEGDSFASRIK